MPRNTEDYAIVIGIDTYPQLRPLGASASDATAFAHWLKSAEGGGLEDNKVKVILSPPKQPVNPYEAEPVQKQIDGALFDFGANQQQRIGRRLYFYFAGHGFGPTFDDVGMLMANAATSALNSNIGLRRYRIFFHDALVFDELVFILDCCRDSARSTTDLHGPIFTWTAAPMNRRVRDFVLLAAAYGEKAFEPESTPKGERRGVLTQAVLEGLTSGAANSNGQVTAFSLRDYVKKRVPEIANEAQLRQEPEVLSLNDDIVLVTLEQIPEREVRILVAPELQGEVRLCDGSNGMKELERRRVGDITEKCPWDVRLKLKGKYVLEHMKSQKIVFVDPAKLEAEGNIYVFRFS